MNRNDVSIGVRLALGPVQYYWPRQQLLDFYREVESSPVDIVYLGETVCSKRRTFRHQDWMEVAERLQAAGKQVVLSTLALIEAHSELGYVRRLCENGRFAVEANDMAAVQMLAGKTRFVGGPSLSVYNPRTLKKLAGLGLFRWVMPVELSGAVLADFRNEIPASVETEVFGWGRLPLAYSARCYTSRTHNVSKDDCGFCCGDYPDGLMLSTRDEEEFLVINGIQTQSSRVHCLVREFDDPGSGIDILRISPQSTLTGRVISVFDRVRAGTLDTDEAAVQLESASPSGLCNGYWHSQPGTSVPGHIRCDP